MKASRSDIATLNRLVGLQRGLLGGDLGRFIEADMGFHTAIAAISGNPIFAAVSESMLGWLKRYHTDLLHWSGKESLTLREHEAIVTAIEARDAEAAEAAMVRHLSRSAVLYSHTPEPARVARPRSARL